MFSHSVLATSVLAIASSAVAGPIRRQNVVLGGGELTPVFSMDNSVFDSSSLTLSSFESSHSFNNWGGLSSLNDFDSFMGSSENFCGQQNSLVMSGEQLSCESVPINYVQQQYAVIAEYAKKVLLSNVCEVESQAIVWGQFMGYLESFREDFMHLSSSSRMVTFDSSIASHINDLCDESGVINNSGFDFTGSQIGSSCVEIQGLNWIPSVSESSVSQAWSSCQSVVSSCLSAPLCPAVSNVCESSPPTIISSGSSCESSDCGSSIVSSSSSDYGSSGYGSSVISSGSSCDSSDCGSSIVSSGSSDCLSSDCGSSIVSSSDCGSSDCGSIISNSTDDSGDGLQIDDGSNSTDTSDTATLSDGSVSTLSDGSVALPTDDGSADATDSAGVAVPTDDSTDAAASTDSTDAAAATDSADPAASTASAGSGVVAL